MWTYAQKTGELRHGSELAGTGYSGFQNGKNNPSMQAVHDTGPIPQGTWTIVGPPRNTTEHGPFVLTLVPSEDTDTFGRDAFLIHGDKSGLGAGTASRGCIIMGPDIRHAIWDSGDHDLEVVAEFAIQDLQESQIA